MGGVFKPYDPDQAQLFPASPRDWLPKGHLVYFVADTIDELDLEPIRSKYRECGKGELAYPPTMLLKLLVYGYCTGVNSSRKIARQVEENLAMRYLAGGLTPSHRTIARFREENRDAFEGLFRQVVQIAGNAGLTKLGTVAVDGSKVRANASKHKAMSYQRMQEQEARLKQEIRAIVDAARKQDELEDGQFGADFRGDELPKELEIREQRLEKIRAAKKRLEERKAEEARQEEEEEKSPKDKGEPPKSGASPVKPEAKDQENFTDPDSRIMKDGHGAFEQSYNAQIAVDAGHHLIVAAKVTQCAADSRQLIPMVKAIKETTRRAAQRVLADSGYRSEACLKQMNARKIDAYVSIGREGKDTRTINPDHTATIAMARKLKTKRGRALYKLRKQVVEPVIGWIKQAMSFRQFSMRGLAKVAAEWNLVCMAVNLRRMAVIKVKD
jgi:transposase